jgi:biopolymer transport protein ExbB/TolQ
MRRKAIFCFALLAIFVLLTIAEAKACIIPPLNNNAKQQGDLIAKNAQGEILGIFDHRLTDVKIIISTLYARVTVTEIFTNNYQEKISASYSFPLPENAIIESKFVMAGEQSTGGHLSLDKESERVLERIDDPQEVADWLNQNRPNQFTQHIPEIAPGEQVLVTISYRDTAFKNTPIIYPTAYSPEGGEEEFSTAGVLRIINPYLLLIGITLFCMFLYLVGTIIRRFIVYYQARNHSRYFVSRITKVLRLNHWPEAINLSRHYTQSPVAKIMTEVFKTLEANAHDTTTLPELCGSARSRAIAKSDAELKRGLRRLKTTGWLALMLGFLGTIISLLEIFQDAVYAEASGLSAVAGGLSESFTIALFGLLIALPAIWAHKYFSSKATIIGLETDKSSWELLDCLLKKRSQESVINQLQSTIYSDCYS